MTTPKVIDHELCLQFASGKPELAKELLAMFLEQLPDFKQRIIDTYDAQQFAALEDHVHKLLGGTRYCGVPRLHLAAKAFEIHLKKNSIAEYPLAYEILLGEINAILAWRDQHA